MNGYPINVLNQGSYVSTTNPFPVTLGFNSASSSNYVTISPSGTSGDAFGRLRTSQCYTLGDYKHMYTIDPLFVNSSNGGSIVHNADKACVTLSTNTTANSYFIHQTRAYHNYQPGKGHFVMSSINFLGTQTNVTKRTGYFDNSNGIFVELDGNGILSFNIRNTTSGTISTNRVVQSNWNGDKLDGSGTSGYTINMSQTQLFFTDFQWLGVGRVRCGFVLGGNFIVGHEFNHANIIPAVYLSYPSLPVRCEIRNTGIVSSPGGSMDQICATVISEGGYVETGYDFSYTPTSGRSVTALSTLPVLCIALKNTFKNLPNRMVVKMVNMFVYSDTKPILYELRVVPSVNNVVGGSWAPVDNDSGVQYNFGATSLTNLGTAIANGMVPASQTGGSTQQLTSAVSQLAGSTARQNLIAQNFDSTDSQVYLLYVRNIDTTAATNVYAGMQWREIY